MNIYENIYIGSFIYQLGIEVGKRKLENMSSINLFQQTPSDCKLSDLISSVGGRYLIIEFKRNDADKKEDEKSKKLINALKNEENRHLIDISKSCHYIGIGTTKDKATIDFYKYLDYFTNKNKENKIDFINRFLTQHNNGKNTLNIGISNYNDFIEYIKFLQRIYKNKRKTSTGGIIIHKDKNGKLFMLPTNNIEELILNIKKINETKKKISKANNTLSPS